MPIGVIHHRCKTNLSAKLQLNHSWSTRFYADVDDNDVHIDKFPAMCLGDVLNQIVVAATPHFFFSKAE